MTLVEVYAELVKRGVRCFSGNYDLDTGCDAVAVKVGNEWGVFLDDRRIRNAAEEMVATSHELAHIVSDATYGVEAPRELVRLAETVATRKQMEMVLPWESLCKEIRRGLEPWEIAEETNLTERFVRSAIDYWMEKRGKIA